MTLRVLENLQLDTLDRNISIEREISGIGFQPVDLSITGWKPMPRP